MQWFEALQAFVVVVENKSFVGAARKLHMPTSKVTKLIQWLEARLKTILLIRTTRQVHLTENGEYFFQRAKSLVSEWQDLQMAMQDREQSISGVLHVASPPGVSGAEPFVQIFTRFLERYPDMTLTVSTFAKPFNFIQAEVDIFIGRDPYLLDLSGLVSKACLSFNYGIYASPAYLKTHPKLKTPADLIHHNCLGGKDPWLFRDGIHSVKGNFSGDIAVALQKAACQNLGIARVPTFATQHLVDEGKLVPLLEEWYAAPEQLKIYYQKLHYQPRKLKVFIDFMLEELASDSST